MYVASCRYLASLNWWRMLMMIFSGVSFHHFTFYLCVWLVSWCFPSRSGLVCRHGFCFSHFFPGMEWKNLPEDVLETRQRPFWWGSGGTEGWKAPNAGCRSTASVVTRQLHKPSENTNSQVWRPKSRGRYLGIHYPLVRAAAWMGQKDESIRQQMRTEQKPCKPVQSPRAGHLVASTETQRTD